MGFLSSLGSIGGAVLLGGPAGSAIGGGIGSLLEGGNSKKQKRAAAAADPFAGQRGQYQDLLRNIYFGAPQPITPQSASSPSQAGTVNKNFGSDFLSQLPGLSFAIQQGQKAATRRASALGLGRSGNLLTELSRVTTGIAQQKAGEELDRLALLAGATSGSPKAASAAIANTDQYGGGTSDILTGLFGEGGFLNKPKGTG